VAAVVPTVDVEQGARGGAAAPGIDMAADRVSPACSTARLRTGRVAQDETSLRGIARRRCTRSIAGGNLRHRWEALCQVGNNPLHVINVVVIDGSRIFGDALAARLADEPDLRVVYSATSAGALRQAVGHSSVDVVVCDAVLYDPDRPGRGQSGEHREPDRSARSSPANGTNATRKPLVILLADYGDRSRLCPAIRSGVRGWVPRDASADDLIAAIREVGEGGAWIQPKVLTALLDELTAASSARDDVQKLLATLTSREREVLSCLVDGLGRVEVAARLHVSTNTVRTHVQSILSKLGVNSSVAAVALAGRVGQSVTMPRH
jgi:DNA-binding NarL/FixJ family response regulator